MEAGDDAAARARRPRRRAVGPAGARPVGNEPRLGLEDDALDDDPDATAPAAADDDERLRRDRPPHHDQGV